MKQSNRRFAKSKYLQLSKLGSQLNLSFSSYLVLNNKLIALDGIKRTVLVSETIDGSDNAFIIHLDKVAAVSVKKCYGSIKPGELKTRKMDDFLKRIDLQFEYASDKEAIVLTFYDCKTNDLRDLPVLERNAKNWQMILSKMAGSQISYV